MAKKPALSLVPTAGRRHLAITDDLPEAAAAAVATFEKVLGGRTALLDALASSPALTTELDGVLRLLADPANDRTTLSRICAQAGILPGELFAAFRSAKLAVKHVESLSLIADGLPAVTKALLEQSLPKDVFCIVCDGTGEILGEKDKKPVVKPCGLCQGTGTRREPGDLDAQKLVLELAELLKRSQGGISITQQTQVNHNNPAASEGGALAQLQRVIANHLYHTPPTLPTDDPPAAVDAEVLPDDHQNP